MTTIHTLGFPRIGAARELKWALEAYWKGENNASQLLATAHELRTRHWDIQSRAGLDYVTVGDFSLYDHVLDHSLLFGAIPERFADSTTGLDRYFRMARGRAPTGKPASACDMTKWFDTNYHYIIPELHKDQTFRLAPDLLLEQITEAQTAGYRPKPVLLGPLSWLWLGKIQGANFDRLELLDSLLPRYSELLTQFKDAGIEWVQMDEPILVLDLPASWRQAFESAYTQLAHARPRLLLATYFGKLGDNLQTTCQLPIDGLHIDAVRALGELNVVDDWLPSDKALSVGIIDGRNIWRTDLQATLAHLQPLTQRRENLWLAPSCSLLHVPIDLEREPSLGPHLHQWIAGAVQKLGELSVLRCALDEGAEAVQSILASNHQALTERASATHVHRPEVAQRLSTLEPALFNRTSSYPQRAEVQRERFQLPLLPTTTIGSFPQTAELRTLRRDFRADRISRETYDDGIHAHIQHCITVQEKCGLDVLVHGEAERNDMVEYFGEQLEGFAFTRYGWVQSYGSRCVKPPILYGDVIRNRPMTLDWITYAQSLTRRPVKGMLTGPVTLLQWSFVRDDQPRSTTCQQLALVLRDEAADLERADIGIIQIDEPALREGLPLRRNEWPAYLDWAVKSFRLASSGVKDETQIHTHMCYSDFNDIIESIAALDADVITIEATRSDMGLLDAFAHFEYPNEIGPGVWDIHSPNVPTTEDMVKLLRAAMQRIPSKRLWVNPDCGLKTRDWPEVESGLTNLIEAARRLRKELTSPEDNATT